MPPDFAGAPRPALPDVVVEHFEEHGFLSLQRRKLLFSLDVPARRLPGHDERIAAHWDGLVVNRPASDALAAERLASDDRWERVTAIRFWLTFAKPPLDALVARWLETPPAHAGSWREAMRALPLETWDTLVPIAKRQTLPPLGLALLVDAFGWNGVIAPAPGAARHPDALVRAAAARALGNAAQTDGETDAALRGLLADPDRGVYRRALWSTALLAPEAALEHVHAHSRPPAPDPFVLRVLGLLGGRDDHARLTAAAGTDTGRPAAFFALADLGTGEALESLVRLLALPDPELVKFVHAALEQAVGFVPRMDPAAPPTPEEIRLHIDRLKPSRDMLLLGGKPRPWRGAAADEPLAWTWRAALPRRLADNGWLRREVPDGFFDALPLESAEPGA